MDFLLTLLGGLAVPAGSWERGEVGSSQSRNPRKPTANIPILGFVSPINVGRKMGKSRENQRAGLGTAFVGL